MENSDLRPGYVRCPHPTHPATIPERTCELRCRHANSSKNWLAMYKSGIPYDENCKSCEIGLALIGKKPKKPIEPKPKKEKETMPKYPKGQEQPDVIQTCKACGAEHPLTSEYWYRNCAFKNGWGSKCKDCQKVRDKELYRRKLAEDQDRKNQQVATSDGLVAPVEAVKDYLENLRVYEPKPGYTPDEKPVVTARDAWSKPEESARWPEPEEPVKFRGVPASVKPSCEVFDYDMLDESISRSNHVLVIDFSEHEEILAAIQKEAKRELRLPSMQALWHLTRIPTLNIEKEA